jgi:hypothetical protein
MTNPKDDRQNIGYSALVLGGGRAASGEPAAFFSQNISKSPIDNK